MMSVVLLFAMQQYVAVETPMSPDEAVAKQKIEADLPKQDFELVAKTSAERPAIVPASELLTPAQVLEQGRMMSAQAEGLAYRSVLPVPILRDCHIVSTNPAGVSRISDGAMNGRVTFAQCRGFVASVEAFDFSQPTNPSMKTVHNAVNDDALVQGGYRTTQYLRATDGREQAVVSWLNPTVRRQVTISLYREKSTIADAVREGYRMLETMVTTGKL